jgi:CheY-like chemotaxis protein
MAKILVVDDTKLLSTLIARVLGSAGHQVEVALCATDAWKVLETRPVDLMLLDLEMPHMGGLDFLDTLRKIPEWADLPTIVVSGRNDRASVFRAKLLGVADYLYKGECLMDQLLTRIDAALKVAHTA